MTDTTRRSVLRALGGTTLAAAGGASLLSGTAAADATGDIPSHYLAEYRQTGQEWGIDWAYLAGIGWVETHHGQYTEGCAESSAGALGPMQFTPPTWQDYGGDHNGDGNADPCDYQDAIPSATNLLTSNGAPGDWDAALYRYNPSQSYVNHVKSTAQDYRDRYGGGDPGGGFEDGDRVQSTVNLNTRHRPGTDSRVVATMPPGSKGEIMNGPVQKGGYTWWGVHWLADNIWGWSVERYLAHA